MAIDLSKLEKTPEGSLPPIITIYGVDGIGKTPFGLGAEKPIYLPTEKRFSAYGVMNAFQTPTDKNKTCESFSEMCNVLISLDQQEHDYKTVVIDSLDHLEPLLWKAVLENYPTISRGEPIHKDDPADPNSRKVESIADYGFGKGYSLAMDAWRYFYQLLNALRDKGMTIVLIAHYQQKQENPADDEAYDQFQLKLQMHFR